MSDDPKDIPVPDENQPPKPARRKRAVQVKRKVVIRGIRTMGPLATAPKTIITPDRRIIVPGRRAV